ncbi:hypothetical protein EJ04DRAFT_581259, partial [Polyplosphaeria fusca]
MCHFTAEFGNARLDDGNGGLKKDAYDYVLIELHPCGKAGKPCRVPTLNNKPIERWPTPDDLLKNYPEGHEYSIKDGNGWISTQDDSDRKWYVGVPGVMLFLDLTPSFQAMHDLNIADEYKLLEVVKEQCKEWDTVRNPNDLDDGPSVIRALRAPNSLGKLSLNSLREMAAALPQIFSLWWDHKRFALTLRDSFWSCEVKEIQARYPHPPIQADGLNISMSPALFRALSLVRANPRRGPYQPTYHSGPMKLTFTQSSSIASVYARFGNGDYKPADTALSTIQQLAKEEASKEKLPLDYRLELELVECIGKRIRAGPKGSMKSGRLLYIDNDQLYIDQGKESGGECVVPIEWDAWLQQKFKVELDLQPEPELGPELG